jgi:WD40 repeat protein
LERWAIFLPDGRRLVSFGGDNGLKLWDTRTGLEVGTLFGNGGRSAGFGRSRDGNTIYSASEDGDVRVWRAPPLNELHAPDKKSVTKSAISQTPSNQ